MYVYKFEYIVYIEFLLGAIVKSKLKKRLGNILSELCINFTKQSKKQLFHCFHLLILMTVEKLVLLRTSV